ncbi:MAG: hypothetical protein KJO30_06555 [Boseongicola sp.]|nr:hypothetical protein [Boseongicola sp.]
MEDKYFGPSDVQLVARRAKALFSIVKSDPEFAWYGRYVALADFDTGGFETFLSLIRLQGACPAYWIAVDKADYVETALLNAGFRADRFEYVISEGDTLRRAREILSGYDLGGDLDVIRLGPDSSEQDLERFAGVAMDGGVLPPPASVLRGDTRKGVFLMAKDRASGRVVSCAAAIENFHPKSRRADHAFWGMLSTLPEWRGRKIALILGARAIVTLFEDHGFSKFTTGVRAENDGSMALCAKLDMLPGKWCSYVGMDPAQVTSARVTK